MRTFVTVITRFIISFLSSGALNSRGSFFTIFSVSNFLNFFEFLQFFKLVAILFVLKARADTSNFFATVNNC